MLELHEVRVVKWVDDPVVDGDSTLVLVLAVYTLPSMSWVGVVDGRWLW